MSSPNPHFRRDAPHHRHTDAPFVRQQKAGSSRRRDSAASRKSATRIKVAPARARRPRTAGGSSEQHRDDAQLAMSSSSKRGLITSGGGNLSSSLCLSLRLSRSTSKGYCKHSLGQFVQFRIHQNWFFNHVIPRDVFVFRVSDVESDVVELDSFLIFSSSFPLSVILGSLS